MSACLRLLLPRSLPREMRPCGLICRKRQRLVSCSSQHLGWQDGGLSGKRVTGRPGRRLLLSCGLSAARG